MIFSLNAERRDLPASLREEDVLITISRCRWDAWKQRLLSNYQFDEMRLIYFKTSQQFHSRSGSKPVWEVSPRSQSESSEASASSFPSQRGLLLLPAMTTTDSSPVLSVVQTVEEQLAESSLGPTKWDWRTKGRRDILWPKALSRAGLEPALSRCMVWISTFLIVTLLTLTRQRARKMGPFFSTLLHLIFD